MSRDHLAIVTTAFVTLKPVGFAAPASSIRPWTVMTIGEPKPLALRSVNGARGGAGSSGTVPQIALGMPDPRRQRNGCGDSSRRSGVGLTVQPRPTPPGP